MTANFYLTRDLPISFHVTPDAPVVINITPKTEDVFPHDKKEASWKACNILRTILRRKGADRNIHVTFTFPGGNGSIPTCRIDGLFIKDMINAVGFEVNLKAVLADFKVQSGNSNNPAPSPIHPRYPQYLNGSPPNSLQHFFGNNTSLSTTRHYVVTVTSSCPSVDGKRLAQLEGILQEVQHRPFIPTGNSCTAKLTIRIKGPVTLDGSCGDLCNIDGIETLSFTKRILNDSFETDIDIIAGNGNKIPCHKIFLTGHSEEFSRMLSNSFMEGQTNTIAMEDMSEIGVKALLSYLYYEDVGPALTDCDICVELMEASEKYGLGKLQEKMKSILQSKDEGWFNLKSTLELFVFTRGLRHCSDVKTLAARIIKAKQAELQESESFEKFVRENPDAVKDLFCSI